MNYPWRHPHSLHIAAPKPRRGHGSRASTGRQRRDRPAFTYFEAVLSMLILGTAMAAGLTAYGAYARGFVIDQDVEVGQALATELMEEILSMDFEDPAAAPGSFGPAPSETKRSKFNDVDDYNGLTENPPETRDGTALTQYSDYTRIVVVQNVDDISPATNRSNGTTASKRILVVVSKGGKAVAQLTGFRMRHQGYE